MQTPQEPTSMRLVTNLDYQGSPQISSKKEKKKKRISTPHFVKGRKGMTNNRKIPINKSK